MIDFLVIYFLVKTAEVPFMIERCLIFIGQFGYVGPFPVPYRIPPD
jgi:hypothetical protein